MPRQRMLIPPHRNKKMIKTKTKYARVIAIVLMFMMLFGSVSGCTGKDTAQTREIAEPLIEASLVLDSILYGEGLATTEEGRDGKYARVTDEKYKSVEDIRLACAEIYTSGLCQVVENSVLSGKGTELGNIYARYIDREGVLYKYDGYEPKSGLADHYDYESIKTVDATNKRIIFTIDRYTAESDEPMQVEFTMLWSVSAQKWQLDSPTY